MIAIASFRWSDHSDAEITLDRPTCTRSIVRAPFSPPADCFIPQNDRRSSVPSTRRLTVECISELDYSHLMDRLTESIWMYKVYTNLYQMKSNGCWLGWQLAAKASLHVLDHNADEQISIILAIRERDWRIWRFLSEPWTVSTAWCVNMFSTKWTSSTSAMMRPDRQ